MSQKTRRRAGRGRIGSSSNPPAELAGRFTLYGVDFAWLPESHVKRVAARGVVPLVRCAERLSSRDVRWLERGNSWRPWFGTHGDDFAYRFTGTVDALMPRDASCLRLFVHPKADPWSLTFVLFRGIFPRLLHLRGVPSLHGSAVQIGGNTIALVGHSGAGKSTLAAALVQSGASLVSDDVLPVRRDSIGDRVAVGPGLAELRLQPHPAWLAGIWDRFDPPRRGQTKGRWVPAEAQIQREPTYLHAVYMLRPSQRAVGTRTATPVSPLRAFRTLVANSFWLHPDETAALASDAAAFACIARTTPVRPLHYRFSAEGISAAVSAIRREADRDAHSV